MQRHFSVIKSRNAANGSVNPGRRLTEITGSRQHQELFLPSAANNGIAEIEDPLEYEEWFNTNVARQKEATFFTVNIEVAESNVRTGKLQALLTLLAPLAAKEVRIVQNCRLILEFVQGLEVPALYNILTAIGLVKAAAGNIGNEIAGAE